MYLPSRGEEMLDAFPFFFFSLNDATWRGERKWSMRQQQGNHWNTINETMKHFLVWKESADCSCWQRYYFLRGGRGGVARKLTSALLLIVRVGNVLNICLKYKTYMLFWEHKVKRRVINATPDHKGARAVEHSLVAFLWQFFVEYK